MTTWPRMMKRATAAAYCDLSERAFDREINAGRLPAPVTLGGREHWCKNALDRAVSEDQAMTLSEQLKSLVEMRELILAGKADHHAEPWAAHRTTADLAGYERGQRETVERIVAWIRTGAMFAYTDQEMADAIEAGEWK